MLRDLPDMQIVLGTKTDDVSSVQFAKVRMLSVSKTDSCADRSILTLPSAYKKYLVTFKVMTSQVVQRARPLTRCAWLLGHRNGLKYKRYNEF